MGQLLSVTSAFAQEERPGPSLIGKLEGPKVVRDESRFPTSFQEAPQLAEQVSSGALPAVAERIGEDPLVIEPLNEIGTFGGILRRGFTGPSDEWNGVRIGGHDTVLAMDYANNEVVPNVARDWEWSDDQRVLTLYLRRGMKWSDGEPLTADDFMFWYEDMYQNEDLTPSPHAHMAINGKPITMEKVDDFTIRYVCPDPYPLLLKLLAGAGVMGYGPAQYGRRAQGGFAPKHYLTQFHPAYVDQAELDKMVEEAGFDNWKGLFLNRIDWAINLDVPAVTAWIPETLANTPTWRLKRNPYSIYVDTEGNQLPYIDEVVMSLAENLEVLNLRAVAGEYDYQSRHIDMGKLPVLLENADQAGYDVKLDPGSYGGDFIIRPNLTFPEDKDPEIAKWLKSVEFRRALSLGIERDQLNETFWLGVGVPGSPIPEPENAYYPGDEYKTRWHEYDPAQANQILDELGLTERDSEGFRMRTDGKGRLRLELMTMTGMFLPFTQIAEVIVNQWRDIGIDVRVDEVERGLGFNRVSGNEQQLWAWSNDTTEALFLAIHALPVSTSPASQNPLFGLWYDSNGEKGIEPPERMQEAMAKYRKGAGVTDEERAKLGKEIWSYLVDDVVAIGVVGQSPALMGVRVSNKKLGNSPARQFNSTLVRTPGGSIPETFFWKS
ncbi:MULTISPECIES: ABC transporter substrate-binding protein [Chelativorans]|nr:MULTISPECIES: ABC transporter substrate-binding protein [Chelativorans]